MSRKALTEMLIRDVAEGLRVFVTRDGIELSEEQIAERSRNLATNVVMNYSVTVPGPIRREVLS